MKHSFWLVNSLLLGVLLSILIFMFFSQQRVSYALSLNPLFSPEPQHNPTPALQTRLIYENDLFNTYQKTYTPPAQSNYVESSLPQAPSPVNPDKPIIPEKKFLLPLKVKLRGIIAVNDQSLNRIIIADDQTQDQKSYSVGEMVEDGLLIKIFPNKAVFLRSNGQQETLYLNERDIEEDALISQQKKYWVNIIQRIKENNYVLDHEAFIKSVHNISVFFDLLNITTVYEKGITQGLRLGNFSSHALGSYLGLQSQDIITHCNNYALTSISQQNKCYNDLVTKQFGDSITLTVERSGKTLTLSYTLKDLKDPFDAILKDQKTSLKSQREEELKQERIKLLKKKYKFAPTAQELKIQQKLISTKKNNETFASHTKKE